MPIVMQFGKHKGEPLDQVPTPYLKWCVRTCDLAGWLRDAILAGR